MHLRPKETSLSNSLFNYSLIGLPGNTLKVQSVHPSSRKFVDINSATDQEKCSSNINRNMDRRLNKKRLQDVVQNLRTLAAAGTLGILHISLRAYGGNNEDKIAGNILNRLLTFELAAKLSTKGGKGNEEAFTALNVYSAIEIRSNTKRMEFVLRLGATGGNIHDIVRRFNALPTTATPVSRNCVRALMSKFRTTFSVRNVP
ncbi:unnamed protein product [Bemisia tabaci]|uniref:Uncharacterized protein n=1 Tax=Bemisia tabaci TaxID=7038 RepID=A0A9P0F7H9_BEMTA|nr:unnamed protein product [Bemisia tabaci]